jgi:hypothetical protein
MEVVTAPNGKGAWIIYVFGVTPPDFDASKHICPGQPPWMARRRLLEYKTLMIGKSHGRPQYIGR